MAARKHLKTIAISQRTKLHVGESTTRAEKMSAQLSPKITWRFQTVDNFRNFPLTLLVEKIAPFGGGKNHLFGAFF
jgi:hypothetical protein